jgi:NAD(P)-dependent dehydrogenase (short-subunit alcohol dehydrogenase family)
MGLGLDGKGALVTGGGSGIGLGCARRLAAEGAVVTICGRSRERLDDAVAEIDGDVRAVTCDVTDEEQVEATVAAAAEATGSLDVVVASAGGSSTIGPITQVDTQAFRDTMDLNVVGTFLALKHAAPVMIRGGGGSFIGISSIAGSTPHRWFGAYGPSKAGIEALIQMGAAITEGGPVLDDYLDQMPIARPGTVADIAAAAAYLAGDQSTWVTGQVLHVDGGHSLRRGPLYHAFLEPVFGEDGLRGVMP